MVVDIYLNGAAVISFLDSVVGCEASITLVINALFVVLILYCRGIVIYYYLIRGTI